MTSSEQSYLILVVLVVFAFSNFRLTSAISHRQREARRQENGNSGRGYSDHETGSGASLVSETRAHVTSNVNDKVYDKSTKCQHVKTEDVVDLSQTLYNKSVRWC